MSIIFNYIWFENTTLGWVCGLWKLHPPCFSCVTLPFSGSCAKGKWRLHHLLRFRFLWHACMYACDWETLQKVWEQQSRKLRHVKIWARLPKIWRVLAMCSDSMTKHVTGDIALQLYWHLPYFHNSNWKTLSTACLFCIFSLCTCTTQFHNLTESNKPQHYTEISERLASMMAWSNPTVHVVQQFFTSPFTNLHVVLIYRLTRKNRRKMYNHAFILSSYICPLIMSISIPTVHSGAHSVPCKLPSNLYNWSRIQLHDSFSTFQSSRITLSP